MKKNIIALAVAGVLVAPLAAQADVTVSGQLQAEVVSVSSDDGAPRAEGIYLQDASVYGVENSHTASAIFITASEDLGNGMKALAKYGFDPLMGNDGSAMGNKRDAYIGLTGGFGTVLAGRMSSPYKTSTVKWDPFLATFMQARGNGGMSAGATGHGSYLDNVVAYANKFGMATVVAAVSFDETDADGDNTTEGNHAMTFSVNVPVGPVEVAVAYLDASDMGADGTVVANYDAQETKVGVKYNAGAITVAGQYETRDNGLQGGATADGETFLYLTGSYAMGATTLSASYGQNTETFTVGDDMDHTYAAIGVKHAFSKGTSVYAGYRSTSPDTAVSSDESVIGAGMRVKF